MFQIYIQRQFLLDWISITSRCFRQFRKYKLEKNKLYIRIQKGHWKKKERKTVS